MQAWGIVSYLRLQAIAATALAVGPSIACTIEVPGIVGEPTPGGGGGGGGSSPGGSDSVEGKLSSNGLMLSQAAMLLLGTEPLGVWLDDVTAEASPDGIEELLTRADGGAHLEYTALCALESGTSLRAGDATYAGLYGFAPEWVDQPCDESCQRWVTACLLAHTNITGSSIEISMRGAHAGMEWSPGIEQDFAIQEAGFYGNLFARNGYGLPMLYACMGRGLVSFDDQVQSGNEEVGHEYLTERLCSTGSACGLISTGPCYFPPVEEASTCESDAGDAGYFADCRVEGSGEDFSTLYREVVTTYLAVE